MLAVEVGTRGLFGFFLWTLISLSFLPVSGSRPDIEIYRKNSKIWDTSNNCHNCPKNRKV